jgi:hypothetical protein
MLRISSSLCKATTKDALREVCVYVRKIFAVLFNDDSQILVFTPVIAKSDFPGIIQYTRVGQKKMLDGV